MAGDLRHAITAYEAGAAQRRPGDAEATLGLGQAQLLKRTAGIDLAAARGGGRADPDDVEAQTLVADLELIGGHVDDAFARLIELVRRTSGDERDAARKHLIELFGLVGDDDPRVGKARQTPRQRVVLTDATRSADGSLAVIGGLLALGGLAGVCRRRA